MMIAHHLSKPMLFTLSILLLLHFAESTPVQCVVQAFGTGLGDKGISVTVKNSGFGCADVFPWKDVTNSAKFDSSGKAEVKLFLHASTFGVCMTEMTIKATFSYNCVAISRKVQMSAWGFLGKHGSCRVLEQQCGPTRSAAAIPYIDMWCRRPTTATFNAGKAEEMRLSWLSNKIKDKC